MKLRNKKHFMFTHTFAVFCILHFFSTSKFPPVEIFLLSVGHLSIFLRVQVFWQDMISAPICLKVIIPSSFLKNYCLKNPRSIVSFFSSSFHSALKILCPVVSVRSLYLFFYLCSNVHNMSFFLWLILRFFSLWLVLNNLVIICPNGVLFIMLIEVHWAYIFYHIWEILFSYIFLFPISPASPFRILC